MSYPKNCATCPDCATCHAAYYGATQCKYTNEINRAEIAARLDNHEGG